jgi:Ankyrin repeats (3 copies)
MDRRRFTLGFLGLGFFREELPPLHAAVVAGNIEEVRRLLASDGALVVGRDEKGNTPLHHAAWHNRLEIAQELIARGATVDARRIEGRVTPLESASYFGHQEMVQLLLVAGADVNAKVYEGFTPLHQAVRNGHVATCQILMQKGARLDAERDNGYTPLHTAAEAGQTETLLWLLACGADPTHRGKDGKTALAISRNEATREILQRALATRADVEAKLSARELAMPNPTLSVRQERVAYESHFERSTIEGEWGTTALGGTWRDLEVGKTPKGNRSFLGPFSNQEVRLALGGLPTHNALRLSFDLFVLGSWDGNGTPRYGPDIFDLAVLNGPTLLHTTFYNPGMELKDARLQAYPADYPLGHNPGYSGASERGSLGLFPDEDGTRREAVYRLAFTFTHRSDSVVIRFSATGLEDLDNESWALSNLRVTAVTLGVPAPVKPVKPVKSKK